MRTDQSSATPIQNQHTTKWAFVISTFFGAGYGKPGPGTWGSVAAVLLWAAYAWGVHPAPQTLLIVLIAGIALSIISGVPAATIAARESGREDPQFVVIDEVAGQWIALLGCPIEWRHMLISLVLFRLFDITKPFPIRRLENLPEGWGIVFDDVAAGLYAWGVGALLRIWFLAEITMPRNPAQSGPKAVLEPRIDDVVPAAAMPHGEVELHGAQLGPDAFGPPAVLVDGLPARVLMSRPTRLAFSIPDDASTGMIEVRNPAGVSNTVPLRIARQLSDGLHPVTSPAVSRSGMIYATISGQRGKEMPVSVVRVSPGGRGTPFVSGIMNATGLAISPEDDLFVTSRAEGNVYRVDPAGEFNVYAEGMGVATGAAFDSEGNLFVGDRSGTIFKINPQRQIFVHATLEPSVSAYHLAMSKTGTLFVTAPSLSSNEAIWAIEPNGDVRPWFRGLGRPQGLALSKEGDVYVAACLRGRRGLVRVTAAGEASLALSGINLIGIAFSPLGTAILATNEAVYDVDLGVEGMSLN